MSTAVPADQHIGMKHGAGGRAMRRLKPDPVPDELVAKILRAGIYAPNGGNNQKWRFLVVKDPKIKKAVQVVYKRAFDEIIGPRYKSSAPPPGSDAAKYKRQHDAVEYLTDHYHEAPVWIVACIAEEKPTRWSGASIYPAVQNLLLAATSLGLGAVWLGILYLMKDEVLALLGEPQGEFMAVVPVGWGAAPAKSPKKRTDDEIVRYTP